MRYEAKYLERLASVYVDQYELHGHEAAQAWFKEFLNKELRRRVRPLITKEVLRRSKESKNDI